MALETAASVSIVREVEVEARARLGDFAPESMTAMELLEQYLQSRAVDDERRQLLLDKAQELIEDSG